MLAYLDTLLEEGDFGIFALDLEGRVRLWNRWLEDRTGLPAATVLGRRLEEVLPGIAQRTLATCRAVLAEGKPRVMSPVLHETIVPFLRPSRQIGRFLPVVAGTGEVEGALCLLQDVAPALEYERFLTERLEEERRAAEEELRRREERYRSLVENAPDAIVVNLDDRVVYANPAALRLFGASRPEEIIGRSIYDLFPEDQHRVVAVRIEALRERRGAVPVMEERIRRLDGTTVEVEAAAVPFPFDERRAIHVILRDITERKRVEEALRLSKERYEAFVKQSSEAICLFELEHGPLDTSLPVEEQVNRLYEEAVVAECNLNFAVSHGYQDPREMTGFRIGQVFPRLAPQNVLYLRDFITGGYRVSGVETKELTKDGGIRYFLNSLVGNLEGGRLLRIWGAKQDITRIKEVEEEVRRLNAELERRVEERTAALAEANRELEAFTYSVSHDLRAPLRAIAGYSAILEEDYGPRLDEEGRRICRVIGEAVAGMGRLIDALLALSRVGRAVLRRVPVDMAALARQAYEEIVPGEGRDRVEFRLEALPPAEGDPVLLRQVWVNLIGNAVKFSRTVDRPRIEIGCRREGEGEVYFVRDNGCGFDMAHAGRLFQVFERLHRPGEFEGTGVGLAIVKRIVERHGGRLWAEGRPGEGAVFFFTLRGG
ncbi:MAG TPA: PAS domain S-box protein [Syntrophales bacterium]|nr:PAS domain S-box protein [Syntrophales bacterium]